MNNTIETPRIGDRWRDMGDIATEGTVVAVSDAFVVWCCDDGQENSNYIKDGKIIVRAEEGGESQDAPNIGDICNEGHDSWCGVCVAVDGESVLVDEFDGQRRWQAIKHINWWPYPSAAIRHASMPEPDDNGAVPVSVGMLVWFVRDEQDTEGIVVGVSPHGVFVKVTKGSQHLGHLQEGDIAGLANGEFYIVATGRAAS